MRWRGWLEQNAPSCWYICRRLGYIFLKRFSKAWRASVGRDGDGGGLVAVEGWEYEVGAVSFSMVMRNS